MTLNWTLGIDVGGTFTDVVAANAEGEMVSTKTPSTPDQSDGVLNGIAKVSAMLSLSKEELLQRTAVIVHGTTVATNALLEYKGAKVGLITTAGFRDELEFRRSYKESTFNPRLKAPHAICPRRYRLGVPERLDKHGDVVTPLNENAVREAAQFFLKEGIQAVAICFLFSFKDPTHERRAGEIVKEVMPDAFLSLSCDVLPEIREFERVSTTVVNAFTGPAIDRYVTHLAKKLADQKFGGELFIMQSNGGVLTAEETAKFAVGTLLSGPAGGVTAAAYIGEKAGSHNLITVDMGGTSYDISVTEDLTPSVTTDSWIARYRIAKPMLDIHTVGAGGGSIAWVDNGGALRVGPRSAGSSPGPACYGRGGTDPTVTDVNLLLGLLNPDFFLGGEMSLDIDAARAAVEEKVAKPLGMDITEAAFAVSEIVNNNMANATHFVTTKRGLDPRSFALVAAGGAGALHAGKQAELLGVKSVIVPKLGPTFCALGDVVANLKMSESCTFFDTLADVDMAALNDTFAGMETAARNRLSNQTVARDFDLVRSMDLRYEGEIHEVTVPIPSRTRRITPLNIEATTQSFHDLHEKLFSHKNIGSNIEVLTLRLDLIGVRTPPPLQATDFGPEDPSSAIKDTRDVFYAEAATKTQVYDGTRLQPGHFITGPAIIEQWGTTIVVQPNQEALIDRYGNCIIEAGLNS